MKKTALFKIFTLILTFGLIFSTLTVVSFAEGEKIYVSIGNTVLYQGAAPDAESFNTVYYKNGGILDGSEADYNAKLEFSSEKGFTLTLCGLDIANTEGEYSIFAADDLNLIIISDSKIRHTVHANTKDRYAISVNGDLSVEGDGELSVYLRGDCDFNALDSHLLRSHNTNGADKIIACDGRSEQEKQMDSIKNEFENKISKTNYELALAKLSFANTTEALKEDISRVKTIAIAAVIIGSVSLLANAAIATVLLVKRGNKDEDFDDEDDD